MRQARKGRGSRESLPYPELANVGTRAEGWTVELGEDASTSMYKRNHKVMTVPNRDEGPECEHCPYHSHVDSVRVHEMFHSRFSPQGNVKNSFTQNHTEHIVDPKYIHMAEEERVDTLIDFFLPEDEEIYDGVYSPYCPAMFEDSLRHHLNRGEYREAAELTYMMMGSGMHHRMTEIFFAVIEQVVRQLFASLSLPPGMWELFADGLGTLMKNPAFLKAWEKLPVLERKKVAKQLAHLSKLYEHSSYIMHRAIHMDFYWARKTAKRIPWRKMLRYAFELQDRFREYDTMAQRATDGMLEVMNAAMATNNRQQVLAAADSATSSHTATLKNRTLQNSYVSPEKRVKQLIEANSKNREETEYWRDQVKKRMGMGRGPAEGEVRWGDLIIVEPKLTKKYPVHKLQRGGSRAREAGDNPRMMHRYTSDGKIFKTKRKVYGASVLVDDSGSMGFNEYDLKNILDKAPGSIVGIYAGAGRRGWLKIVARDGKRIADGEDIGVPAGNNIVDYPALEWLSEQPWPRIWISDGQVVAINYGFHALPRAECDALCEAAGIVRVDDARAAQAYITGQLASPVPKRAKYRKSKRKELKV